MGDVVKGKLQKVIIKGVENWKLKSGKWIPLILKVRGWGWGWDGIIEWKTRGGNFRWGIWSIIWIENKKALSFLGRTLCSEGEWLIGRDFTWVGHQPSSQRGWPFTRGLGVWGFCYDIMGHRHIYCLRWNCIWLWGFWTTCMAFYFYI